MESNTFGFQQKQGDPDEDELNEIIDTKRDTLKQYLSKTKTVSDRVQANEAP